MSTTPTAPSPILTDQIRAYLEAPRIGVIATVNPDGTPHQATVWYALTPDDAILVNSRVGRQWPRNVAGGGRVSLAVVDEARVNHWVGVKGHAEPLHDGDAALADIAALARRYGGDPDAYCGQQRVSFLIRIESTFEHGA